MSDESEVDRAVEISMGPNSILLVQYEKFLTSDQRESLRESLAGVMQRPGRQCVVLEGGMTVTVLHRDDEIEAADEGEGRYLDGKPV